MKSQYSLVSIYKDIIQEINTNAIPQTVILLENNFINNIQSNDYFTIEEKQAIRLYLEYYDNFTEENINEFNSGLLNEGIKDWIGNAWNKIKNVFGNIKDFVVKIWTSIKNFVIEQSKKVYNWTKGKLSAAIPKIKEKIKVIKDKAQLTVEATHIFKVYSWLKPNSFTIFNNLGKKAEEKAITEIKEVIFNSTFTRLLVENTEEIPTNITEPGFVEKLKKIGVAIKPFLETLAIIFNPLKYAVVQIFKELTPQILNVISQFVAKLGGPTAIKYIIIPGVLVEIAELKGIFHGTDDLLKASLELIPGIGSFLEIFMEVGHGIFIILAIYEILHEILHGLGIGGH